VRVSAAPMLQPVQFRRLIAAMLVCASIVLGISVLAGSGRAASRPPGTHTCSVNDKQFLTTVQSNMTQLSYWSDSLTSGDVAPVVVIKQARAEAKQIDATRPTDTSMTTARTLLRQMFLEYAGAVRTKALGGSPGKQVQTVYTLANYVHDLLVEAQPGMTAKGCNLEPLLSTSA
jgi:hypothetical protein